MLNRFSISAWQNQIAILWFGQAILMAVMVMSFPYWPLFITQLGSFSPQQIRFFSACIYIAPFLTAIISAPLWGKLGDQFGYKPMVVRATLSLCLTQTLILLFTNVYLIFIFRLLEGLLAGFIVAAQSWALAIAPEHAKSATIGKLQSATAVGNLLGPLVGGMVATYAGGYQAIFRFSALSSLLVAVLFIFTLNNPKSKKKSLKEKFHFNQHSTRTALSILLIIILVQAARAIITPVFALFVTQQLNGNDITVGILYAATGAMIFVSSPAWGKWFDKFSHQSTKMYQLLIYFLLICGLIQFAQAYTVSQSTIFILRLCWGVCLGAILPTLLRLLIEQTTRAHQGLFLGWGSSATKFGNLLGMIMGAITEMQLGYTNTFIITALCYFVCAMIVWLIKETTIAVEGEIRC